MIKIHKRRLDKTEKRPQQCNKKINSARGRKLCSLRGRRRVLCAALENVPVRPFTCVFHSFFPLLQARVGGRAESRVKDIRNYIKTSEAKNSQVTAQKLRDLVAGDSSFHSLSVTPSPRPSSPSHPPRHCPSYLPPGLSFSPVTSSLPSASCYVASFVLLRVFSLAWAAVRPPPKYSGSSLYSFQPHSVTPSEGEAC